MTRFLAGISIASLCGVLAQAADIPAWLENGAYVTLMGSCIYAVIELYRDNKGMRQMLVEEEKKRVTKLAEEMRLRDHRIDELEGTITKMLIEKANNVNKN